MDGKPQASTVEHLAAGLDSNVARSHAVDDCGQKQALSEHIEDKPSDEEPLDAITMLNDPDFAAKEKALVKGRRIELPRCGETRFCGF